MHEGGNHVGHPVLDPCGLGAEALSVLVDPQGTGAVTGHDKAIALAERAVLASRCAGHGELHEAGDSRDVAGAAGLQGHAHAVSVIPVQESDHIARVGEPALLQVLVVVGEAARGKHDGLCVHLDEVTVELLPHDAGDGAVLVLNESQGGCVEQELHPQTLGGGGHSGREVVMRAVFAKPVERFELPAVIVVYNAGEIHAAVPEPRDVVARGVDEVEPFQAVGAVVRVAHLARDDLSGFDLDAGVLLHLRAYCEEALGSDAATALAALLLENDDPEALLGGLDRGRQARVTGPDDADVACISGNGRCFGAVSLSRCLCKGRRLLQRAARDRHCARGACGPKESPARELHHSPLSLRSTASNAALGMPSPKPTMAKRNLSHNYP